MSLMIILNSSNVEKCLPSMLPKFWQKYIWLNIILTPNILTPTDIGHIASEYHLNTDTIEVFSKYLRNYIDDVAIIKMISESSDFKSITVRKL